jgi:thiosulfate/3-mercaptopyruvate sulfurtransferase
MPAPESFLVDAQWLSQHLNDPQVVIVDCRFSLAAPWLGLQQYTAGHIPGAHYLDLNRDLSAPVQRHGGRHPLASLEQITAKANQLGIHSHPPLGPTWVIAYDDSRFAFSARLWWMLRYLGHDQVALLDGGIKAWEAFGGTLSNQMPQASQPGNFIANPRPDWVATIEEVRQSQQTPDVMIIDSREPARFRGEYEPIDPIAGSVPGAVNYLWSNVSDETTGQLKSPNELADYWAALDEVKQSIVYCGSGVTACVNLFAQAMAHKTMGKLYPGGWSDWCSYLV